MMIETQKGVWLTMLEMGCMQSKIDSIIYDAVDHHKQGNLTRGIEKASKKRKKGIKPWKRIKRLRESMKDQPRLSTDLPRSLNDENTLEARVKHGRSRRVCAHKSHSQTSRPQAITRGACPLWLRLLPLHMAGQ